MNAERGARKRRKTVIVVDYLIDGCMARDEWTTGGRYNAKVMPDGRGYVKTAAVDALYATAERIVVRTGRR